MSKHDTVIYIGAGTDVIPLYKFPKVQNFIYVDCLPRLPLNDIDALGKEQFIFLLNYKLKRYGFQQVLSEEENLQVFKKNDVTVKYYTNLRFPIDVKNGSFLQEVKNASILICFGYIPHHSILGYMKPGPKIFIGDDRTCYNSEEKSVVSVMKGDSKTFEEHYQMHIPFDDSEHTAKFETFLISQHASLLSFHNQVQSWLSSNEIHARNLIGWK